MLAATDVIMPRIHQKYDRYIQIFSLNLENIRYSYPMDRYTAYTKQDILTNIGIYVLNFVPT